MTLWAHVPTPLAPQESSLFVVIQSLCTQHRAQGEPSVVVVSDNREIALRDAGLRRVDYTRYCPRQWFNPMEMKVDHLMGLLGRARPYTSRIFIPAIEELTRLRPEVVLLHEGHHATPSLPLWAEALPDSQIVLYAHIGFSRGYRRRELRRLLRAAAGVVFVSNHSRARATGFLGTIPAPTAVVNNGVETEIFHPRGRQTEECFRITYVGEINPRKGLHLLVAALPHLARLSDRNFVLQIVGGTRHLASDDAYAYEQQVRAAAAETGIHVDWLGRVSHDAMPAIYRGSDVVCVPSIFDEPFGMVVLEALACEAAVIASPRGGLRDAGGDVALYVDPLDDERVARAIADLANDPDRLRALQARGRAHATRNGWAARYWDLRKALETF
ncbi:MAG: glycosyltransferase family 4 protein, partial [Gaiellaceae bacterium]